MTRVVGVIPARFESSRFPGKPLVQLLGCTMIERVARIAAAALGRDNVFIATDDLRIRETVSDAGFGCILTGDALTGTDRVWQASESIDADVFLNIQGDEPLLDPEDIRRIAARKVEIGDGVVNGMCRLSDDEDPANPNLPKVVTNEGGELLYMSRAPIPGSKQSPRHAFYKQVCIYAFSRNELDAFGRFGRKSKLEAIEDIEILRFLDLGVSVHMTETLGASLAVDVPEDVVAVEAALRHRGALPVPSGSYPDAAICVTSQARQSAVQTVPSN